MNYFNFFSLPLALCIYNLIHNIIKKKDDFINKKSPLSREKDKASIYVIPDLEMPVNPLQPPKIQ